MSLSVMTQHNLTQNTHYHTVIYIYIYIYIYTHTHIYIYILLPLFVLLYRYIYIDIKAQTGAIKLNAAKQDINIDPKTEYMYTSICLGG